MKPVVLLLSLMSLTPLFAEDWALFLRETSMQPFALEASSQQSARQKNVKAALFMSAVLPGAGQVYAKSYWKAAAFVAIEAAGWTIYAVNNKKGKDIEREFQLFADTHWSEQEYFRWIAQQSGIAYSEENMEKLREWEHQHFSHGLHRQKDQQYYEMIGKYHQFNYGWDDFRASYPITITHAEMTAAFIVSPNRYFYESRRHASNEALKTATTGVTIAMVNHILSAVDAAWSAHRCNQRLQAGLQIEPLYFAGEMQPMMTLRLNW
ncbi:MAG: DUF5683 domain-containing protein [candidate division KSB1 bacterium]|nr:DUF5683 domain-containing protein [candidate division KSB1 bacterium]